MPPEVKINSIQYWDSNNLHNCDLTLRSNGEDYYLQLEIVFHSDENIKEINYLHQGNYYCIINNSEYGSKIVFVGLSDDYDTFVMGNPDSVLLIDKFFNDLNKEFTQKQEHFRENIEANAKQIRQNNNIIQLIYNFISHVDTEVFLDPDCLKKFENYLFNLHEIGLFTLWSSGFESKNIDDQKIKHFKNEFAKLIKLLDNKIKFETSQYGIFLTWKLLRLAAIKYFHGVFNSQYESFYTNIDNLNLDKCLKVYCSIDTINVKSQSNASVLTYYLMYNNKFCGDNFLDNYNTVVDKLIDLIEERELELFEKQLSNETGYSEVTINDIDMMNGSEFEQFVSYLFEKMGYSTTVTKTSGDQGIDVIAEKNGQKIGIQAKCYTNKVTNSAIQEVVAGIKHYNLDKGIVVTNYYFTKSAIELAESNGIILWDREFIKEKILEIL